MTEAASGLSGCLDPDGPLRLHLGAVLLAERQPVLRLLAWGYNAGETIRSGPRGGDPGRDILVTINVGDALVFPNGLTSSGSSSTETHYSTIDELGINT